MNGLTLNHECASQEPNELLAARNIEQRTYSLLELRVIYS